MGLWVAFVPYIAVLIGLHVFSSAWLSMLLYQGAVFALVGRRLPWKRLRRGWHTGLAVFVFVASAFAGVFLLLAYPVAAAFDGSLLTQLTGVGVGGASLLPFAIYYCVVNPAMEELLWRGHLGGTSPRPILTDALFSGYHVIVLWDFVTAPWLCVSFFGLVFAGWVWRQIATRYEGLVLPYLSHLSANIAIMVATGYLSR